MTNKKQKKCILSKLSWATWILLILITACVVISAFSLSGYIAQKQQNTILQGQIDSLKSQALSADNVITEDSLYIEYYKELSNKTDNAISAMLTIISIIAGVILAFSTFIAFKAPMDIENRIEELKKETNNANESILRAHDATEDAKYQTRISRALINDNEAEVLCNLTSIIEDYPKKYHAYVIRGSKKQDMKNYDGAIIDYNLALANGVSLHKYNSLIAIVYYNKKDYSNSIKFLSDAINEDDSIFTSYYNRGLSYFFNGDYYEAKLDMQKSLKLNPENPYAYQKIYECIIELMKKEKDEDKLNDYKKLAEENIYEAYRLYPKDSIILKLKKKWDEEHKQAK